MNEEDMVLAKMMMAAPQKVQNYNADSIKTKDDFSLNRTT